MKTLLTILLLFSSLAHADGVLRGPNGDDMIVFKDSPCVHAKVVAFIKGEFLNHFKTAGGRIASKNFAACWAVNPNDPSVVYLIDEDGDQGAVPFNAIQFDPKV